MIQVGQTYERAATKVIYTVVGVEETWFSYGAGGAWKSKLVPRAKLMAVVPEERAGEVVYETIPTGILQSYGYTRLA